jgi:hypothetical protein
MQQNKDANLTMAIGIGISFKSTGDLYGYTLDYLHKNLIVKENDNSINVNELISTQSFQLLHIRYPTHIGSKWSK